MKHLYTKQWDGLTGREVRDKVLNFYKTRLQGTRIVNKDIGVTIYFNKKGRLKTARPLMSKEKAVVIYHLSELLSEAMFANFGKAKEKHKAVGFLNFQIKVRIDGKMKSFRVPVMITKDGKFQYDLHDNYK